MDAALRAFAAKGYDGASVRDIATEAGRAKRAEEREFYLRMAIQQRWQVREVARQIDSGLFERAVLNPPKLSTALREMQPQRSVSMTLLHVAELI